MSLVAILQAVRDQLKTSLDLQDHECQVHDDPQPHPDVGKRFFAVYPGSCGPGSEQIDYGLSESLGVNVGLTVRLSGVPQDRVTEEIFLQALRGIEPLSRKIVAAIHMNYEVMSRANDLISGEDKFFHPLTWAFTTMPPEVKLGEWFWSGESNISRKSGVFVNIAFVGAERIQKFANME